MPTRYYLKLPDARLARGADPAFAFRAVSAEGFAEELEAALRENGLFVRWRAAQADPDAIDPALGAIDPIAVVSGTQKDLHVELIATTSLPGTILRHRLRLLAGSHWELRDVVAG